MKKLIKWAVILGAGCCLVGCGIMILGGDRYLTGALSGQQAGVPDGPPGPGEEGHGTGRPGLADQGPLLSGEEGPGVGGPGLADQGPLAPGEEGPGVGGPGAAGPLSPGEKGPGVDGQGPVAGPGADKAAPEGPLAPDEESPAAEPPGPPVPSVRENPLEDGAFYKGVTRLEIQCNGGKIAVRESSRLNDGEIVIFEATAGESLVCRQEGEELDVFFSPQAGDGEAGTETGNVGTGQKTGNGGVGPGTGTGKPGQEVEIRVPEGMVFREAELESLAGGELTVDRIHADSLSVDVENGTARVTDALTREAELDCVMGQLDCRVSVETGVSAESEGGTVNLILDGKNNSYDYKLEADTGLIVLGDKNPEEFQGMREEENVIFNRPKRAELEASRQGTIHVFFAEEDFPTP